MSNTIRSRLRTVSNQLVFQKRSFHPASPRMTKLDIHSKLRMNSGHEIPMLGFGVYQTPADVAEDVSRHAVKHGYRHLFYTSKVPPKEINYEGAKKCVDESLSKTGLDYIDLYLLHAPYGGKDGRLGAWKALVEAVDAGKIRSIGVSNYGVHHLEELETYIKETDLKDGRGKGGVLSVNQVELHPWLSRPDIVSWCEKRGVVLEAYCPLARATRMDEPEVVSLAKKHGKKPSQILLRWGLQKNFVILPKSVTHSRIEENRDLYDFELSAEDMETLNTGKYEPCAWDPTISHD